MDTPGTKYCQSCGYANIADATACKACGSKEFSLEPPPEKIQLHTSQGRDVVPMGVEIMAIAQLLVSVLEIFLSGLFAGPLSSANLGSALNSTIASSIGPLSSALGSSSGSLSSDFQLLIIIFAAVSLLFSLVIAFGLLTGKSWARTAMIFNGLFDLILIPVGTIFGVICIVYFMRQNVVDYFKKKTD